MANQVEVTVMNAIIGLKRQGWSHRRIARELHVDRGTVGRYVRLWAEGRLSNPAISTPGSGDLANPAISTPGSVGRRSLCEVHRRDIERGLEKGLSAQRIWQDLVAERAFTGSYQSVKRFAGKLRHTQPRRFQRVECAPGEEAQVDFGRGAPTRTADGKLRRPAVLRVVLSHSRKGYSEAVWHQNTESFIRVLENAFRYLGGVPRILVTDNLKAAVLKADWYDPELNPKLEAFARHYGTAILPTRIHTPRHNGKVERGIGYVKDNGLKGRVFESLAGQNAYLLDWESRVADQRIHGTTRRQVGALFQSAERDALLPLPNSLFPCFNEGRRSVHRDGFVEVDKAYYEVPEEYVTRTVWVRWDHRLVRVFNTRWEQVAVHARVDKGRFSRRERDRRGRHGPIQRSQVYWLGELSRLGTHIGGWSRAMLKQRGPQGIRVLMGLQQLSRKHTPVAVEAACRQALGQGAYRLKDIRRLLTQPDNQEAFAFIDSHPLIRDLREYGDFFDQQTNPPKETCAHE